MATFGVFTVSARVNSRPATSGMLIVFKKPGPTMFNEAFVFVSGPASNPSTTRLLFQLSPASTGTTAATTLVTPGIAAISSSTRSNSWRVRSLV
jgi:hypothetical protein